MKHGPATIAILFVCAMLLWPKQTVAQAAPPQQSAQQSSASSVNSSTSAIPAYPDSPEGLEHLMKDMLKLQKKGDAKSLAPYVQSLVLPNPTAWFSTTFGDELGTELAATYERTRIDLPLAFPDMLADLQSKHAGSPRAIRFTDSCNPNASETEYPLLLRRTNLQPIYDVRLGAGWQYFTIRYFAYSGGAFRFLGNFKLRAPEFAASSKPKNAAPRPAMLKVGGTVIAAKLIKQVAPRYPEDAKYHHVQGTVILHALIDTDGSIQDIQLLQGTCSLAQAATKAVRQWRYLPTTLEGKPVWVDTTISVVFTLGG